MSLTFTDWENCTDDATAQEFLLNWTANTGMVPYTHLEAIRQAIAERYVAAGLSLTGVLASPLAYGSSGTYAIAHAIDTAITALIPSYINHNDHGGDWNGVVGDIAWGSSDGRNFIYSTPCAPPWTAASILAAIGAQARQLAVPNGLPYAAWVMQVKAILDQLRWVHGQRVPSGYVGHVTPPTAVITGWTLEEAEVNTLSVIAWADLDAMWNSGAVWAAVPDQSPYGYGPGTFTLLSNGSPMLLTFMRRRRETIQCRGLACNKIVEIYYRLAEVPDWAMVFTPDAWAGAAISGRYYRCDPAGVSTNSAAFSVGPVTAGNGPAEHGIQRLVPYGWYSNFGRIVVKYNVPGGFTFQ